jgi:hypothetical protein
VAIAPDRLRAAEVKYFVLANRVSPYLLARVRWPDVAQAITAGCRDWQDDPGLFDLPYDASSAVVTLVQATAIAAGWGASLPSDTTLTSSVPPLIRRMPANWSNLSPAEKRAWSLEFVLTKRRANARHESSPGRARRVGLGARLGRRRPVEVERRHDPRLLVGGRAQIRLDGKTVSADLVDLSQGGMHCVVLDAQAVVAAGTRLTSLLVLKGSSESQIRLNIGGTVTWNSNTGIGSHFGVAFEQLNELQAERVGRLLVNSGAPENGKARST